MKKIRYRLKVCQEQHHECAIQERPILPRRVIDMGTGDVSASVRLIINNNQMKGDYTCLSYCWGGSQEVATTASTLEQFSTRLPWDKLPQTIRDAITVTRSLAIRFLWVDALCILQDNNDDMSIQIGQMGSIYKNAKVTIAAANSRTVTEGFLKDRTIPHAYKLPFYLSAGRSGSIWLRTSQYFDNKEVDPLESRGWTLQESLLSRRMLYYGSLDLMWKCQRERFVPVNKTHYLYLEKLRRGLPTSIFNIKGVKGNDRTSSRSKIWEEVVDTFAGRELTVFEDRLPALAGIASELQNIWKDTYLAGMWQSFLIRQLGWQRNDYILEDLPPEPYRSPGWSWASSRGRILFSSMVQEDAEFVGCIVIPVDKGSPFGRVESGRLTLRAALKSVRPSLDHRYFGMDLGPNGRRVVDQNSRLLLLGYGRKGFARCLVITPVGTYMRIGATSMNAVDAEMWRVPNLKRENVTMI
ncbi:HET-domain-containing protein [Melanomma pulvis-pyrius CBS 109.77]|uniref:HET-domain-containing protein n=1 Tax=Melanomma pulvis-pyrius CBS 109.77 TaxID=1314802 RepID=A0A6A6XKA2_9PLEO|nr:HET-domain-containing protein [Melanomma pulvis-pyrius CBS 109.77]